MSGRWWSLAPETRRALSYVAPYRRSLAGVLALSLAGTAVALVLPYSFRWFVDALVAKNAGFLMRAVGLFAALTLVSYLLNVVSGIWYTRVSADILFDMRLALFRHLQALSPRFYARMPLGQIVSRLNNDVGEIQRVATDVALAPLSNVLFLAGTITILAWLDPLLFAASLAVVPVALWAMVRYRRRLEASIATLRNESANIGTFLIDTLQGMKLVVGLGAQDREAARFRLRNDSFVASLIAMRRLTYLAGGLPGLILALGGGVVLFLGGRRVIDGAITMGTLVAFMAYLTRMFGPVQGLMGIYASMATAKVSLRRVHEILDAPIDVRESTNPEPMPRCDGAVTLRNVTFAFGGVPVLDRVSLSVAPGERVAVVGASGAGKSTIAELLARQLDPDNGAVLLDGRELTTLTLGDVRRHVVVVDQDPFVFNASIAENLRFARPDATDGDLNEAIAASGLAELVARLPDGINTNVGERGKALSAGERQRLSIGRAFLADPAVLVLDEATGALDPATEAQVVGGYESVMRGRTTIVITHRRALAQRADRVIVIREGRVAEQGTPAELASRGGAFASLFAAG